MVDWAQSTNKLSNSLSPDVILCGWLGLKHQLTFSLIPCWLVHYLTFFSHYTQNVYNSHIWLFYSSTLNLYFFLTFCFDGHLTCTLCSSLVPWSLTDTLFIFFFFFPCWLVHNTTFYWLEWKNVSLHHDLYLAGQPAKCRGVLKTLTLWFSGTPQMRSVSNFFMLVLLIEFQLFISLSVTVTILQGYSCVKHF